MKIYCYNYKKFYVSFTVTTKQKSTVYAQKINEKKTQNIPLQEIINSKLKNGVSKTGRKKQRNYIHYPIINYNGKESEKEYMYV